MVCCKQLSYFIEKKYIFIIMLKTGVFQMMSLIYALVLVVQCFILYVSNEPSLICPLETKVIS